MPTRFEIIKNGNRVCVCGICRDGNLSVILQYSDRHEENSEYALIIGGLGIFDESQERANFADWPSPEIDVGDEITIRILPPGDFDEPLETTGNPSKTIDDPDFGEMHYCIDAWSAQIEFANAPIQTAHLHLRADDSGPSPSQRNLVRGLKQRHAELFPDICRAIVNCQAEIKTPEELASRLAPNIGINMYDDSKEIAITYCIEEDAEDRGYYVTLRDWKITAVVAAE